MKTYGFFTWDVPDIYINKFWEKKARIDVTYSIDGDEIKVEKISGTPETIRSLLLTELDGFEEAIINSIHKTFPVS